MLFGLDYDLRSIRDILHGSISGSVPCSISLDLFYSTIYIVDH